MGERGFAHITDITPRELRKLGIVFDTELQAGRFCAIVMEDLEVRIGEKVSRNVTEEEDRLFDECKTDEETEQWLNRYCPDFRTLVADTQREVEDELIARHSEIPGARFSLDAMPDGAPLEAAGLRPELKSMLRKAGIRTIGQIRRIGSVYDVPNITPEERYDLMMLRGRI